MGIKEITLEELDVDKFIAEKIEEISSTIGNGLAINALSGGVDSSVVTILGHKALGDQFKTYIQLPSLLPSLSSSAIQRLKTF